VLLGHQDLLDPTEKMEMTEKPEMTDKEARMLLKTLQLCQSLASTAHQDLLDPLEMLDLKDLQEIMEPMDSLAKALATLHQDLPDHLAQQENQAYQDQQELQGKLALSLTFQELLDLLGHQDLRDPLVNQAPLEIQEAPLLDRLDQQVMLGLLDHPVMLAPPEATERTAEMENLAAVRTVLHQELHLDIKFNTGSRDAQQGFLLYLYLLLSYPKEAEVTSLFGVCLCLTQLNCHIFSLVVLKFVLTE